METFLVIGLEMFGSEVGLWGSSAHGYGKEALKKVGVELPRLRI